MNKENKFVNIFACVRIIIYILIVYMIINLLNNNIKLVCNYNEKYGILCPSCGTTRATLCMIKGEFSLALKYNLIYTIALFPIGLVFIIDDIIFLVLRIFKITNKPTLIEVLFELESGEINV